jgi:hypothetical protein
VVGGPACPRLCPSRHGRSADQRDHEPQPVRGALYPQQLTAFRDALAEEIDAEIDACRGGPITIRFDYQPDWVLIEAAQRAGIDLEPGGLPLLPVKTGTRVAPGLVSVTEGDAQRDEPVVVWEAGTPGRSSAGRTET